MSKMVIDVRPPFNTEMRVGARIIRAVKSAIPEFALEKQTLKVIERWSVQ